MTMQTKNVHQIASSISNVTPLWNEIRQLMFGKINIELTNVCRRKDPTAVDLSQREASMLQLLDCNSMKTMSWKVIIEEMDKRCPLTLAVISSLVDGNYRTEKKLPVVCLIYSLSCFMRNPHMSRLQRVNTMLLTEGNASSRVG